MKAGLRPVFLASTYIDSNKVHGVTITSVVTTNVGVDNEEIMSDLKSDSGFLKIIRSKEVFALNLLSFENKEAAIFYSNHSRYYAQISKDYNWEEQNAVPVLKNASAVIKLYLKEVLNSGANSIVFSSVQSILEINQNKPLLYGDGKSKVVSTK
jgi:flavin reductase (DIM6/NTAB) family NADH-FMN oxidoreductase RutF